MRCVFGVREGERVGELGEALQGMIAWVTDMWRVLFFFIVGPQRLDKVPAFRASSRAWTARSSRDLAKAGAGGSERARGQSFRYLSRPPTRMGSSCPMESCATN